MKKSFDALENLRGHATTSNHAAFRSFMTRRFISWME